MPSFKVFNTFLVSGVLVDLHSEGCRQLNLDTVQQVMAAKWAVEVINNQSLPHELNIGEKIIVIIIRILMMAWYNCYNHWSWQGRWGLTDITSILL